MVLDRYNNIQNSIDESKNDILFEWENKFGKNLVAEFKFEKDSYELSAPIKERLFELGPLLQKLISQNFIISLEGYSSRDEVNIALAKRRANTMASFFLEEFDIPYSVMRINGTQSESIDEFNKFRLVEIIPFGNIDEPTILTSSYLSTSYFTLSQNGKLAATGSSPIQIWDLTKKIKIMEFPFGQERAFSPNGRYVASSSNYKKLTNDIFIYDLITGQIHTHWRVSSK